MTRAPRTRPNSEGNKVSIRDPGRALRYVKSIQKSSSGRRFGLELTVNALDHDNMAIFFQPTDIRPSRRQASERRRLHRPHAAYHRSLGGWWTCLFKESDGHSRFSDWWSTGAHKRDESKGDKQRQRATNPRAGREAHTPQPRSAAFRTLCRAQKHEVFEDLPRTPDKATRAPVNDSRQGVWED